MKLLKRLYGLVAIVFFIVGICLFLGDFYKTDAKYFQEHEKIINQGLQNTFQSCESTLKEMSQKGKKKNFLMKEKYFLILAYDFNHELTYWSDYFFIPSKNIFKKDLKAPFLYQEKEKFFYVLPLVSSKEILLGIIPLAIKYPITNEYLSPYYFGVNSEYLLNEIIEISHQKFQSGINYYGKNHEFLLSLRMPDAEGFRYPIKIYTLVSWAISFFFLLLFWVACYPIPKGKPELLMTFCILIFRGILVLSHFPYSFVKIPLFSSQILAINEWNPSLGDLSINFIVIAFIIYRWYRYFNHPNWNFSLSFLGVIGIHIVFTFITYGLFFLFFSLFRLVIENSLVYFEFTDIFEINIYSGLLVFNQSLALLILYFIFDTLAHFSIHLLTPLKLPWKFIIFYLAYFVLLIGIFIFLPLKNDFF